MSQIIYVAIELIVMIIAFLLGKYVFVNPSYLETVETISFWVKKLVISAKAIFEDGQGDAKREYVVNAIKIIAKKLKIDLTDEQIRALIEDAYNAMKAAEKEAKNEKNN